MVDDFTIYTWIYPLHNKSQATSVFIKFKKLSEKFTGYEIKYVQSDWGGEFRPLENYLENEKITFRHPCSYTSHQNGRVERKHRHIIETCLSLLAQSQLPLKI